MLTVRSLLYVVRPGIRGRIAEVLTRAAAIVAGGSTFVRPYDFTIHRDRDATRRRYRDQVDAINSGRFARCLERVNGSIPLPAPAPRPTAGDIVDRLDEITRPLCMVSLPAPKPQLCHPFPDDLDGPAPARRPPPPPVLAVGTRRDKTTGEVTIGQITLPVLRWNAQPWPGPRLRKD